MTLVPSSEDLQSSWATNFSSDNRTTLANWQLAISSAFKVSTVATAFAVCSSSINR